jgi:hydrogenase expression/formation protein HypC
MCLGIPGRLVKKLAPVGELELGLVDFGGARRTVCTACVPEAQLGDYVIVHAGVAISRLDAAEAERLLRELAECGEPVAPSEPAISDGGGAS